MHCRPVVVRQPLVEIQGRGVGEGVEVRDQTVVDAVFGADLDGEGVPEELGMGGLGAEGIGGVVFDRGVGQFEGKAQVGEHQGTADHSREELRVLRGRVRDRAEGGVDGADEGAQVGWVEEAVDETVEGEPGSGDVLGGGRALEQLPLST